VLIVLNAGSLGVCAKRHKPIEKNRKVSFVFINSFLVVF